MQRHVDVTRRDNAETEVAYNIYSLVPSNIISAYGTEYP